MKRSGNLKMLSSRSKTPNFDRWKKYRKYSAKVKQFTIKRAAKMGLDSFALAKTPGNIVEPIEFAYWRKHNSLHNWMTNLAIARGIVKDPTEFNCVELRLTEEDIDNLEKEIMAGTLVTTNGFFFGSTDQDHNARFYDDDMEFIKKAREYMAEGLLVVFESWW